MSLGIGFGLVYVPAIVSVGYYFEKKRSLAIGIGVCGAGVGTFILSPLNRILEESYGLKGAFLVKSAIVLNMFVCGCLIRPVAVEPSEIKKSMLAKKKHREKTGSQSHSNRLNSRIEPESFSDTKSSTIAITITGSGLYLSGLRDQLI